MCMIRRGCTASQRSSKPVSVCACDGSLSLPRDHHHTSRDHAPARDHTAEYIRPAVDHQSSSSDMTLRLCACPLHSLDSCSSVNRLDPHQHAVPSAQLYAHASSPSLPFPPAHRHEAAILSPAASSEVSRDMHVQPDIVTSS